MCAVVTIYLKKKINEHSVVCAFVSGTSYAYDYIYIYMCVCVCGCEFKHVGIFYGRWRGVIFFACCFQNFPASYNFTSGKYSCFYFDLFKL